MQADVSTEVPCNLCGSTHARVVSERSRSGAYLRTVACNSCGLVWSDPRPHDARKFYEESYRLEYKGTFEPKPKHVLRAGKVALSRLEKIRPHLCGRMRVLDVGSGGGEFAHLLQSLGHDVKGVEPNRGYARYSAAQYGIDVTVGLIGDIALPADHFDLITIWHVLEHTEDPGAVLLQLRRALRPGGVLVVEVPNVEAVCQSPASTFHEAHLYNFNGKTLARLAEKAGLSVQASRTADDGGNIAVYLTPAVDSPQSPTDRWILPGNCERITRIVRRHTPLRHWLSCNPYRRFFGRMRRMVVEACQVRRPLSGRERLDALYRRELSPRHDRPATRVPLWMFVPMAYGVALVLEEMLLDRWLPEAGWNDWQATALYVALQGAIVLGIVSATYRPRTTSQYVRFAAWSSPLFVLPAYC